MSSDTIPSFGTRRRDASRRDWASDSDEVGGTVRYCRVPCYHNQQFWLFSITVLYSSTFFSRELDGLGTFRLIFVQSTCVITSMEIRDYQSDSVARLMGTKTDA